MKNFLNKEKNNYETMCTFAPPKPTIKNAQINREINCQQCCECKNITVVSPNSLEDINKAILSIKNNEACIIDLSFKKHMLTDMVFNYLKGAVYALNASMSMLIENVYILTPSGSQIKKY